MGGHHHFKGKGGVWRPKININFFVRNEVLNIFRVTIFSKRTIFTKITVKKNYEGRDDHFSGKGCPTTKINIIFSMGNGVPNTTLKFFPQKPPYWVNESHKNRCGAHFPPYQWFYGTNYFRKNCVHQCVDSRQPYEFHENRFKTASCIMTVIIIIN